MGGKRRQTVAAGGQKSRLGVRSYNDRARKGEEETGEKKKISGIEGWKMGGDTG